MSGQWSVKASPFATSWAAWAQMNGRYQEHAQVLQAAPNHQEHHEDENENLCAANRTWTQTLWQVFITQIVDIVV